MGHFLIIDPDEGVCARIRRRLASDGHFATSAPDLPSAGRLLERLPFDVVICDLSPPGGEPRDLVRFARSRLAGSVVLVSGGDLAPSSSPRRGGFRGFVGRCPEVREALRLAARAAPTDAGVLLTGEPGTGKDRLAREIHRHSRRRSFPFVSVDCAALPPCRPEEELIGRFREARGGTLFLEQVETMDGAAQALAARVLQDGGWEGCDCAVRVIGASAGDPGGRLAEGRLRPDLFFRLAVVPITLPPLRERGPDIERLARAFQRRACARLGFEAGRVEDSAAGALRRHPWPGNLDELEACIERAVRRARGGPLTRSALGLPAGGPGVS